MRQNGLEVLLDQVTLLLLGVPRFLGNKGGLLTVVYPDPSPKSVWFRQSIGTKAGRTVINV